MQARTLRKVFILVGVIVSNISDLSCTLCTSYEWVQLERYSGSTLYNAVTVRNITEGSASYFMKCAFSCMIDMDCNTFQYHADAGVCLLAFVNYRSRMLSQYDWFPDVSIYQVGDACRLMTGNFEFHPSRIFKK